MRTLRIHRTDAVLITAVILSFFMSARFQISWAPWIVLPLWIFFFRNVSWKRGLLLGLPVLIFSSFIQGMDVIPMPWPILLIFSVVIALKTGIIYFLDKAVTERVDGFASTLVFPAAWVTMEWLDSFGGGGTWGSLANSQFTLTPLIQIVSVTGIWGVSFLVSWFASLVNWIISNRQKTSTVLRYTIPAGMLYLGVLIYGFWRLSNAYSGEPSTIDIAGITLDNSRIMEVAYEDLTGKRLKIPAGLSQSSPLLQEASKGVTTFIEEAGSDRFDNTRKEIQANLDSLFHLSTREANRGARAIAWSEGLGLVLDEDEADVIERGLRLADDHDIYLYMALATIYPGPVDGERRHMMNKIVVAGPDGQLLSEYLKSKPVPFAEMSYGSDGIIPVIETGEKHRLAHVICYDADFHGFMRQTGEKMAGLLIVPSGDWKAIDPVHSHMAAMRGIENGMSVFRPVSRAHSMAVDAYGRILATMDFFNSGEKILRAEVPVQHVPTPYLKIGDIFAYVMAVLTSGWILFVLYLTGRKLFSRRSSAIEQPTKETVSLSE